MWALPQAALLALGSGGAQLLWEAVSWVSQAQPSPASQPREKDPAPALPRGSRMVSSRLGAVLGDCLVSRVGASGLPVRPFPLPRPPLRSSCWLWSHPGTLGPFLGHRSEDGGESPFHFWSWAWGCFWPALCPCSFGGGETRGGLPGWTACPRPEAGWDQ